MSLFSILQRLAFCWITLITLVFPFSSLKAQDPFGLDAPEAIAPYLNGHFPPITPGVGGSVSAPTLLSETGAFSNLSTLTPTAGLVPYNVNSPLWSDGAAKQRWIALPNDGTHNGANETIGFQPEGPWTFPRGTVLVKHFALPFDARNPSILRRLETRFFVHGADGQYYGVTYRWRPDESDADLLPGGVDEVITLTQADGSATTQTWSYPSREECLFCHKSSSGSVLSLKTHQLNGLFTYFQTGREDNQLRTWNSLGMFNPPFQDGDQTAFSKSVNVGNVTAPLETRVRSYLDSNCSHCHQPGGTLAAFDARFHIPLQSQNIILGTLLYDQGIEGAHVVTPHNPSTSMARIRMASQGEDRMPPVGRNVIDQTALSALTAWINTLEPPDPDTGPNRSPAASDDLISTAYQTTVVFDPRSNDVDQDEDSLTPLIVSLPSHGEAILTEENWISYSPDPGFFGTDEFTYRVSDIHSAVSNLATIIIQVAQPASATSVGFTDRTVLVSFPNTTSGVAMGVADMNADQRDDIILLHRGLVARIDYQEEDGAFTGRTLGEVSGIRQWSLAIADVDQNGYNDLLSGGYLDGLHLFRASENGASYQRQNIPRPTLFIQGSNFVDINEDGWLDFFACNDQGLNEVFRNNGSGGLVYDASLIDTRTTVPSDNSGNYSSIWTDYDGDGDLDLYLAKCRTTVPDPTDPRRINMLMQNDGANHFTDVAAEAGLNSGAQSWTADFGDIDNDGDLDCFIGNHSAPSRLLINDGQGHFTDITASSDINVEFAVMQSLFRDFNNDGYLDLILVGQEHRLYLNDGDRSFTRVSDPFPGGAIESCAIGDLNHDGFLDIYAGYAQLYNTPTTTPDRLFLNNTNPNGFLTVHLEGVQSNRNAVGARLELHGPWGIQVRDVRAGESYGITNSFTQRFGLGNVTRPEKLVVRWPSGLVDQLTQPRPNEHLHIREGSTRAPLISSPGSQSSTTGEVISLLLQASDPTNDPLTFFALNLPTGLNMNATSGKISGTITASPGERFTVVTGVTDGFNRTETVFTWIIESPPATTFAEWLVQHDREAGSPDANGDGDVWDDLLEYSLGGDPDSGIQNEEGLELTLNDEELDLRLVRPKGLTDVNYTLQASGDLKAWSSIDLQPIVTDLGDGNEELLWQNLASSSLLGDDHGFVRVQVELASPDSVSHTAPWGYLATPLHDGYQTHGVSLLHKVHFASRVAEVHPDRLTSVSGGLELVPNTGYYLEVTDGPMAGHRWGIRSSSSGNRLEINSGLTGSPLSNELIGAQFVIRPHRTVGELYPTHHFKGGLDPSQTDQIQLFNGVSYDGIFLLSAPQIGLRWVHASDLTLADQGSLIIPPGQGCFLECVGEHSPLVIVGEVRTHAFRQSLAQGYQLVSEGFPLDLSPEQRGMLQFRGGLDPSRVDQIQFWKGDTSPGLQGYGSLFFFDSGAGNPYWTPTDDISLPNHNAHPIFHGDRAVFLNLSADPTREVRINPPWITEP